jgi:16S rRNA G527 N7-methylase RsmG
MIVTANALQTRLTTGLAPSVAADEALRAFAIELAHEVLAYGIGVLPRELYGGRVGSEIAAMVAEDVEAALWMGPLLDARQVQLPSVAVSDGDEDAIQEQPTPRIESVFPRVVEIGAGVGLTAFVLAHLHRDQTIELVEPEHARLWFWRRLVNLYGVRNLKIHAMDTEAFAARNARQLDLVIVKRMAPTAALDFAVPLLRERGRILSFQRRDRAAEIRKPRRNADGLGVRLETTLAFQSAAARPRTMLSVGLGLAELDGQGAAA